MVRNYKLTPLAKIHLKEIWLYTDKTWGEKQAEKDTGQIEDCLNELAGSPLSGRKRDEVESGLRSCRVAHHHIFYFVSENFIEVVGILHERMDPLRHIQQP